MHPGATRPAFPLARPPASRYIRAMANVEQQLDQFLRRPPTLGAGSYITRTAVVVGDVRLGEGASVWYNAVLRGDINYIEVGPFTNIQDNAVVHLADQFPCVLGRHVSVGHSAIVHACTVGDEVLIGMGATVLDGAVVGDQCIIGAHALVTQHTRIPPGSMVLGTPAKVVRPLTDEEKAGLRRLAEKYAAIAAYCLRHGINVGAPLSA
jgi:carbonic anhydrase/acetyltransferase-like protein (isoleucine patch superfamily)